MVRVVIEFDLTHRRDLVFIKGRDVFFQRLFTVRVFLLYDIEEPVVLEKQKGIGIAIGQTGIVDGKDELLIF
jgi:hypothetical protein